MRILHLIYDDLDNPWVGGGGATRTLEISSRIVDRGHRVVVLCGGYPGAPARRLRRGVRYRHVGGGASHVASRLSFMAGALRLLMRGGYDIVIEDVSPFSPLFSPRFAARAAAVASVQNLSGRHASAKYGAAGWGPRLVETPLLRSFQHFVAVSPGIGVMVKKRVPRADVRVIPNSAGPEFYAVADEQAYPWRTPRIVFLGRIDAYQKGLDRLIEAFDILADGHPAVELVIAGGGTRENEARLRSLVASARHMERVSLLGPVPAGKAAEVLSGAAALAMPSRYEAWPLAAIEAGALGVPVVGSHVVGVRDAAPQFPAGHGLLVAEGDIAALAAGFDAVLSSPALRSELGRRGREWAARFTWDALAAEQLAFYEEAVEKSGRRRA